MAIPEVSFFDFLARAPEIVKNPLPFHHDNFEKKGDTFRLQLGLKKRVIFSRNPELLQYTLQKNQKNYTKTDIQTKEVAKYIGKGLLTAEGDLWKTQRKLIQPAFHKRHLAQLLGTMHQSICKEITAFPVETNVDITPLLGKLAFEVVAKALFSGAVREKEIQRLQEVVEASQKMLVRELRQPYLGWWFKYGGLLHKHLSMVREARQLIKALILERKKSGVHRGDLLDMLLAARYEDGTAMAEAQMIDEIMILFTAGHETTANALSFTCQLLAKYPEYQEKIYQEILRLEKGELMEQLRQHQQIKNVLEESMRLYPPAYFIDRLNLEADEFGEMHFERGTSLLFSVMEIHRHKKYWKSPDDFKPERFEGPPNQHSGYYYPFGAGPRMCIGNNFAMFEMQLVIAELLKHFKILPVNETIEILPLITLKPKNAVVQFGKRSA
ncbi:MAG: cytochrome P450 [Bacteroidota bacterium]